MLDVRDLWVTFGDGAHAVRGVDIALPSGQVLGLVGESGCGKTATIRAIAGVLPDAATRRAEHIAFRGHDLLNADEPSLRRLRGTEIGMVFQEPASYLNPTMRIGRHVEEALRTHSRRHSRSDSRRLAEDALETVRLDPAVYDRFPHELSGGMKQRALIAAAVVANPSLLLADEPVTALDVSVQRSVLSLLRGLVDERGMAMILVSHDLAVIRHVADTVAVMYAGRLVERGPAERVFGEAAHPYTRMLVRSIPGYEHRGTPLDTAEGSVPSINALPSGCAYHLRCPVAAPVCAQSDPTLRCVAGDHLAACIHVVGSDPNG